MDDIINWVSGALGAAGAGAVAWFRTLRGRRAIARLISGAGELDEQASRAVSVSIAALQASLDRSIAEHKELIAEVEELRAEVAALRARDADKSTRITLLQAEVTELRAENLRLREILKGMGS